MKMAAAGTRVTSEQLAELPLELIVQLQDAVQQGEKDRLDQLIQASRSTTNKRRQG